MIALPVLGVIGVMVFYTTRAICKTIGTLPEKPKEEDKLHIQKVGEVSYILNLKSKEFYRTNLLSEDLPLNVRTLLTAAPVLRGCKVHSCKQVHGNRLEYLLKLPYSDDTYVKAWYYFKDNRWTISNPLLLKDIQAREYLDSLAVTESPKVPVQHIQARVDITPIHSLKKHHIVHTLGEVPSAVKGKE